MSQFPSSVLILIEKPRGSRCRSELPVSPPTVENRMVIGALTPWRNISATQRSEKSFVHSQIPWAPEPLAWTTRSGILPYELGATRRDRRRHSPLPIEVREEVDQVEILQEQRSIGPRTLHLVRVPHGDTVGSGVEADADEFQVP